MAQRSLFFFKFFYFNFFFPAVAQHREPRGKAYASCPRNLPLNSLTLLLSSSVAQGYAEPTASYLSARDARQLATMSETCLRAFACLRGQQLAVGNPPRFPLQPLEGSQNHPKPHDISRAISSPDIESGGERLFGASHRFFTSVSACPRALLSA